ncbi:Eisosome component PIL1-domain-containing protein [Vararia minispora EC-137]|uniref:Eisosome component PIL1-domain-containing protein n=1 Tax=Vararia minispora EC-137 TaxID=1314806 RepID=A0ACB8QFY2_9AGAM|nr:Eisosome component PIL1-domain-containing protein [Vararia minispora EC-137]
MPVPGFLQQFADKAQDAINKTPLAQHIPSSIYGRPHGSSSTEESSSNRGGALGQLQHQFRTFQIQYGYGSATPVQRIITTEKGVALDLDAFKRDAQAQSKELYMWGQNDAADVKDITDRLAWLNFITGSLASTIADKLNAARTPLKALRDNDAQLAPRRNARASLQLQIDRLEQGKEKGYEKRIVELRDQLRKAEGDDAAAEKEAEIMKRKALRESEQLKFEALREFGEKLSLISQASVPILEVLPSVPPSVAQPYSGAEHSGNVRAVLQHALDSWKPGDVTLRAQAGAMLDRSHTRAFGETHAAELSKINSEQPHPSMPEPALQSSRTPSLAAPTLPTVQEKTLAPIATSVPAPAPIASSVGPSATSPAPRASPIASRASLLSSSSSPPIDPNALNNAPAPIPPLSSLPSAVAAPNPIDPEVKILSVTPTVAETGVPIQARAQDPGPASGSLKDLKSPSTNAATSSSAADAPAASPLGPGTAAAVAARHETAEEEKKRLEREERERVLHTSTSAAPPAAESSTPRYESAEEEKERLEREEKERILRADAAPPSDDRREGEGEEAMPPPYQDF